MPVDKVGRLKDAAQAITSLETPIGDEGAALQDFLEDDSAVAPDELAAEAVGRGPWSRRWPPCRSASGRC